MKEREERFVTCIVCPVTCKAKVTFENGKISKIEDVECARGEKYVTGELQEPRRDFFTVIKMKGATIAVLPVRSTQPVPKGKLLVCSKELDNIVVDAPVKLGQKIAENILGLGVDIIATRDVKAAE
jgi:CxxC motif-containing protein